MALISQLPIAEVASEMARALEDQLGRDIALTTGSVAVGDPSDDVLPVDAARTVVLPFRDGIVGEVMLVLGVRLATAMEATAPDAALTTAARAVLDAGAATVALAANIDIDTDDASEIATETLTAVAGDFAAVPLFENDAPVACVVVRVVDSSSVSASEIAPVRDEDEAGRITGHEFRPLDGTDPVVAPARPLSVLHDVAMEVTAELGRRRLKVRDIAALQPGSVLALDRAAGSPVDLRVNGALVLRGEVVVVDDDLEVRVAEIVADDSPTTARRR
jgi:flagellar motor switch protein FliN/FliY